MQLVRNSTITEAQIFGKREPAKIFSLPALIRENLR
jgi:hypothetical protein